MSSVHLDKLAYVSHVLLHCNFNSEHNFYIYAVDDSQSSESSEPSKSGHAGGVGGLGGGIGGFGGGGR